MSNNLHLNIPGAQGDVAALQTARAGIESTAGELKSTSAQLFQGTLTGTGADAGSDFSMMVDSAVNSTNDIIARLTHVVNGAIDNTVGYDQSGFPAVFR